jgi:uncharacterized protein (TIGR02996 family)
VHELVLRDQLRELPDDWSSWLVYADVLTERGDERGQMLVMESRGESIEALVDAWLASWSELLPSEDGDLLAELRTISQLIALLEPSDEPREGLSPVLEQHGARVVAAVLAWIDRAFDGVPVPDEDHRTLQEAEAADNYEQGDRSLAHTGRWQDLPEEHLLDNQWALSHLDEQGIRYYLPAVMCFALRHRSTGYRGTSHERDYWLTESLGYTLQPSNDNLRDYQERRFALLDRAQRAVIYAFALLSGNEQAAMAWSLVYVAESDGERADWFELYSPR